MSKVRLIMLSLLAVFAISAVATASASAEHLWLVNGARANGQTILSSGGLFVLNAGTAEIKCQKITDVGTITGASDLATSIHFLECTTGETGCLVRSEGSTNGLIQLNNIPTALVLREPNGGGALKVADEFKQNATTKEFVKLLFTADAGATCGAYPSTAVKGQVAGIVENNGLTLNFPNPQLKGNTLEAFGVGALFSGKDTQELETGSLSVL